MINKGSFNNIFEEYLKDKFKIVYFDLFNGYRGCFPKVDNVFLIDIRVIVPYIVHEFMNAKRLFSRLGKRYIEI